MTGPVRRPVIVVPPHRRPHEILLLVVSALMGGFYTFGLVPPRSLVLGLEPRWVIQLWAATLLVSGVLGLYTVLAPPSDRMLQLRLETASMDLGAGALIMYATAILAFAGATGVGSALTFGLWAMANVWRSFQIRREIRDLLS